MVDPKDSQSLQLAKRAGHRRERTNLYRRVAVHLKGSAGTFRGLEDKPSFTLHFNAHEAALCFQCLEKRCTDLLVAN